MYEDELIDRPGLSKYFSISAGTLGVWQSLKRYSLDCKKIGKQVYYLWDDVYRFISIDEDDFRNLLRLRDKTPMLDRKRLLRRVPHSLTTLLKAEKKCEFLKPRHVGNAIRYLACEVDQYRKWRQDQLNKFYEQRMNPYLFI